MTGGKPPKVSNIVEMIKKSFSEFKGDNGVKSASGNVSSQANLSDVPPSNRCVSGQRCCSAAISS